jgi:hypothetical protein
MVSTSDPLFTFGVVRVHDNHKSKSTCALNNPGHRHKQIRAVTCQSGVLDAPPETHYGDPFAVLFGAGLERRHPFPQKRCGWLLRYASGCARHSLGQAEGVSVSIPHSILPGGENPQPERECDARFCFSRNILLQFWPSVLDREKSTQTFDSENPARFQAQNRQSNPPDKVTSNPRRSQAGARTGSRIRERGSPTWEATTPTLFCSAPLRFSLSIFFFRHEI